MRARYLLLVTVLAFAAQPLEAAITGNPAFDGWTAHGNSLSNGLYVRGTANYSFETYSATLTVDAALRAASGNVWSVGDNVIGVGGAFTSITAGDAGWGSFTGAAINSALTNATGPKIQAKFGTGVSISTPWSTTAVAPAVDPSSPNAGVGTLSGGGAGSIQVRSSAYLTQTDWTNDAGELMNLASSSHITRYLDPVPNASVARLIWNVDGNGELSSWQILLNTSQIPGFTWDGKALLTVQNGDNAYTDALIATPANAVVPEPASLVVWSLLAMTVGGAGWWRRRQSAR